MTSCAYPPALVLAVGAPGSGKSTWIGERFGPTQVVCLDTLRGQLTDNESDLVATPTAVNIMRKIVAYRTFRRLTTVVDATNAQCEHRTAVSIVALKLGIPVVAVVFDTPVQMCIDRQQHRERQVPEHAIRRIHAQITDQLTWDGGPISPAQITRIVGPGRDDVLGDVPADMAGAPWLA